MAITYNSYPTLLFSSYTKDNAPLELPFDCINETDRKFLAGSTGFHEMLGGIASFNTLGNKPTNYWLSDRQFQAVEYDGKFRQQHFTSFMQQPKAIKYGVITMKQGGQYMYFLLDESAGKGLKGFDGPYISVSLFMKNTFLGFEEAILSPTGLQVLSTGKYNGGMDKGGYISFVSIALAYLSDAKKDAPDNRTTEKILYKL